MQIEPKVKYIYLNDVGGYFSPDSIVVMERSKAQLIDNSILHRISDMAEYTIEYAQQNKKSVFIRKESITNPMIEIQDIEVREANETLSELDAKKDQILFKVNTKMTQAMSPEAQLALFDFNILNAKLASLGYFITDENKQENYIKIIEADDDNLLDDLESYLDAKAKLDEFYKIYTRTKYIKKELQYAKTIQHANELFDAFIAD